jgi:hypothetical protein
MRTPNEISGRNPFKVPDNYFEEVNAKMAAKITIPRPEINKPGLYRRLRPLLEVAASVTIFIALTFTAIKIFSPGIGAGVFPAITMEEIKELYLEDIDLLTLEENADPLTLNINLSDLNSIEIIDYLLLENISANEIYEIL